MCTCKLFFSFLALNVGFCMQVVYNFTSFIEPGIWMSVKCFIEVYFDNNQKIRYRGQNVNASSLHAENKYEILLVIELFGLCLDVQLLPLIYTITLCKLLSATYHGQSYHLSFSC